MRFEDTDALLPRGGGAAAVIISATLMAVAVVTALHFRGTSSVDPDRVKVPEVVGLTLKDGERAATRAGMSLRVRGRVHDAFTPPGKVVKQDPLAATYQPRYTTLWVTISAVPASKEAHADAALPTVQAKATPGTVEVPRLVGARLSHARRLIARAGLTPGRLSHRRDEDHMDGYVLGQTPAPGSRVGAGTPVNLVVNRTE